MTYPLVIARNQFRPMAWRNGKGLTFQIASHPPDGPDFDWRISLAQIEADGAFSTFPGVDRTITIIGGGLTLRFCKATSTTLGPNDAPFIFPGDVAVAAEHIRFPTTALNVMTRGARCAHLVHRGPAGVEIMIVSARGMVQAVLDRDCTATIWDHGLPVSFSAHGI